MKLKAQFPYFGGKSRIADVVWQALGDVDHYLEPFFGSGAVLLARENWENRTETVNDKDGFVANVWRSIQFSPDETAKWADWPVSHVDLIARKKYMLKNKDMLRERLAEDCKWHDPEIAGYWIWAKGLAIGSGGLCSVNQIPSLIGKHGRGVHSKQIKASINVLFNNLSNRLRQVRIINGDWKRICGGNWQDRTWKTVGYFFDPPYGEKANRTKSIYQEDSLSVASEVAKWCSEKGQKPHWRIVMAGYYEEHGWLLEHGWDCVRWKANGGYANQGIKRSENRFKETLFLSPHCLTNKKQKQCQQLEIAL